MRKQTSSDSPVKDLNFTRDSIKFSVESIQELCERDETPKIKSTLNYMHTKDNFEPIRLKVRYKNTNLNRIKLKFKRKGPVTQLSDLNLRPIDHEESMQNIKGMTSNLNMSKIVNYSTQECTAALNLVPVIENLR